MKRFVIALALMLLGLGALTPLGTFAASSARVTLDVALDKPLLLADQPQKAYVRVGLTGFEMERAAGHAPVNIAIVLDKSGSMEGEKIAKAREAAIMAIERLGGEDILSVVLYDTTVRVLVPATKVSDKEEIFRKLREVRAGGTTALFGGVSKGAEEIRKFLSDHRVNRVILLSDGLANVGPKSPSQLGDLGASLIKEGISVSTIGLGLDYNEDLMSRLAAKSDGTVYFAEKARDLVKVFDQEFGRALSAVAQEIQTEIRCAPGVRPVRVLGREGEIHGQTVQVFINNLYGGREKSIVLEVEVHPGAQGATRKIAWVSVRYDNMMTRKADELTREIEASFTASKSLIEERTNAKVMVDVVKLIASEQSMLAMRLRDKGKIEEAKAALASNRAILYENADRFNSPELRGQAMQNDEDDRNLEGEKWKGQRKQMQHDRSWTVYQ